jgi:hypothetical protein
MKICTVYENMHFGDLADENICLCDIHLDQCSLEASNGSRIFQAVSGACLNFMFINRKIRSEIFVLLTCYTWVLSTLISNLSPVHSQLDIFEI